VSVAQPIDNDRRLEVLRDLNVLDSQREQVYDELTELTAEICDAPICLISLVEEDRQWFKSEVGLGICETPIEQSVCAHAVAQNDYLEIPDTHLDPRTKNNPLCQGDNPLRFYAGAIIQSLDGWPLGTICVIDYVPRMLSQLQRNTLKIHARYVSQQLELTRALILQSRESSGRSSMHPDMLETVQRNYEQLTTREREIYHLIIGQTGEFTSKDIATHLGISHRTVEQHRAKILSKMDASSVAALVAQGIRSGLYAQNR